MQACISATTRPARRIVAISSRLRLMIPWGSAPDPARRASWRSRHCECRLAALASYGATRVDRADEPRGHLVGGAETGDALEHLTVA